MNYALNTIERASTLKFLPSFVLREGSCWYYAAMQVNMVQESLIPCVQYEGKANRASKVIAAELKKGFRDGLEQEREDRFLVAEGNRIQFMG